MKIRTHHAIDQALCGRPVLVEKDRSHIEMTTTSAMAADDLGLVHGGFIFGLADYAAMIAVNDPNVVLGASEVKFLKPVRVGETVTARAEVTSMEGRKRQVAVQVLRSGKVVLDGGFTCFVLDRHVLDPA